MFLLFWIVSLKKSLTKRLKLGPATSPAENDQCFIYKGLWIKNWFVYLKKHLKVMFLTFLKLYLKFCNYLILADRFTWNPSHFYQQNTKNLCLLKPCQVFLHMSYSSLLGFLRSTCKNYVCHFGFTSVGMCRLLCL